MLVGLLRSTAREAGAGGFAPRVPARYPAAAALMASPVITKGDFANWRTFDFNA